MRMWAGVGLCLRQIPQLAVLGALIRSTAAEIEINIMRGSRPFGHVNTKWQIRPSWPWHPPPNTALPCGPSKAENSYFSVNCKVLKNLMQTIASPRVLQSHEKVKSEELDFFL